MVMVMDSWQETEVVGGEYQFCGKEEKLIVKGLALIRIFIILGLFFKFLDMMMVLLDGIYNPNPPFVTFL